MTPTFVPVSDALRDVADARRALVGAKVAYMDAVRTAHLVGWSHTSIAKAGGVSEAAVRLMIKRYGWQR